MKYIFTLLLLVSLSVNGQNKDDSAFHKTLDIYGFNDKPAQYIDTIGAKIIIIIGDSSIRKINGYLVHIYYDRIFMSFESSPGDVLIYLDHQKKPIDPDIVIKYIPLYPLPDRRPKPI